MKINKKQKDMKRTLLFIACVMAFLGMYAQEELAVGDLQNSGCLWKTRGDVSDPVPTIVLQKEGNTLSVQLLNYESNCATEGFVVNNSMSEGSNGIPSLTVDVNPYWDMEADCMCPYNVSFTLRGLETNTFYLKCWWYEGQVTLEEGKPFRLEDITLDATIDGINYTLKKTLGTAMLTKVIEQKDKMRIPAELNYEGQTYAVNTIEYSSFRDCAIIKTLDIPESVNTIYGYSFYGCKLDTLIIRGFLESSYINSDLLYGLGTDMRVFVQPSEVEKYKAIYKGPVYPLKEQTYNTAYRPLVEEGKHWTYDNFMPLRPAEYDYYYWYDLKGDTLIAGKKCLKMYYTSENNESIARYQAALYEENKKVYCIYPGNEDAVMLYDFDCEVGDTIHVNAGEMVVIDIRKVDNGGIPIRIYVLRPIDLFGDDEPSDDFDFGWVEGVGATKDFFAMLPLPGNYNSLKACEVNGEKLYQTVERDMTAEGYHKMGIEGKRWNYIHYYLDENGEHRVPYSYVVRGDTVIRRTTYKKLWYQDEKTERLVCLLYEEGRTVYKNTDFGNNSYDSPILNTFFDFDRNVSGRVFTWKSKCQEGNTNWMVYCVDTIEVNNRQFRRYTCLQKYSDEGVTLTTIPYDGEDVWHDIWVEGVGSASSGIEDQIPSHEPPLVTTSDYTYFVSCYENGECIFTAEDFNTQNPPVINKAYRPLVEDGKVWKVGGVGSNPVQLVEYYYFDGDTIIDGKTCKQMMCQRYVNAEHPDYAVISQYPMLRNVGAWYEEDKKVFIYDTNSKRFKKIYDFSVDANDILLINSQSYMIGPRQTGGINGFKGVYRDVWMLAAGDTIPNTTWLEGIGSIDGPTVNVYHGEVYHGLFLMSCTVGDEVIYLNDEYEDGASPDFIGAWKNRFDFTHTIKIRPKAPTKNESYRRQTSGGEESGQEQSMYGEYSNRQLDINLDPLNDAYQVRITDESGKVVYEKDVNTANIVGLDIDISAYVKGRYTVTIENDSEIFTGEFETQTSGIEVVGNKKEATRGSIYNLQGQRIGYLQKGLNIVNGQKVYVK